MSCFNVNTFLGPFIFLFLTGCTALKMVPDDQVLYTGADIKLVPEGRVTGKKKITELLDANIFPKPNKKFWGMRPGLWFFYTAGNPKKNGLRRFIKNRLGQAPVYMSDIDARQTAKTLEGQLINHGYFFSKVTAEEKIKKKAGIVLYTAHVHQPYQLRDISFPGMDTLFRNPDSIKQDSYLKPKQLYNLERLKAEQERIKAVFENLGLFYFDERYLIFQADTTVGDHQVDLMLSLEPGVPEKGTRIYRLDKIYIHPDFNLSEDTLSNSADTIIVDGFRYVDKNKKYRPETITKVINFRPEKIYRNIDREYTLQHLMSLGSFKYADIRFQESPLDSFSLNTDIYLTPHLKKSLRAEAQVVSKSNNFVGPGLILRFTNRNFLSGSEKFEVTANASYEVQVSKQVPNPLNSFEFGIKSDLSVPRILSPLNIHYPSRRYLPTTEFSLGFRLQQRISFYQLNSFNLSGGYTWRENSLKTHALTPVDINYLQLGKTSSDFKRLLERNPFLAGSFQNQFIIGSRYSYTLNTQVNTALTNQFQERNVHRAHYYFNANIDIAGNLINLIQHTFSGQKKLPAKVFGAIYSQFVRGEIDFRYFFNVDDHNQVATRINAGTGYAYLNSETMPYIKQFSIGGSNSIRAFPARSIGPGTYSITTDLPPTGNPGEQPNVNTLFFIDQRADIKLEGNVEFRFDIVSFLKGALFVDAGNIWLLRADPDRPGGKFSKDRFLKELAVGTGAGLRFDFSFFLLRFDLAFPLRKPYFPEKERWVFNKIDFGSRRWRSDNLILNVAIGYPF